MNLNYNKNDKNVQLEICKYDEELYNTLFKDDTSNGYSVTDLGESVQDLFTDTYSRFASVEKLFDEHFG